MSALFCHSQNKDSKIFLFSQFWEPHFFAEMHSSEGAAGGGGWGEESRRARASRRSEAEAGQFPSKKVRAKCNISPQIVTSRKDNADARRDGRTARDNVPRRFAAKWLGGGNSKRADLSVSYQNQL